MGWLAAYCVLWLALALLADRIAARVLNESARAPAAASLAPVSVIKPVRGADEFSAENFRSWLTQDYPAPVQVVFSLQDNADAALPILEELRETYALEICVNPIRPGCGGKTSNLLYGLELARYDLLVLSDGDIRATPDTLRRIAGALAADAEVVGCLPCHVDAQNLWGRIYAQIWNNVIIVIWGGSMLLGRPLGLPGGTIALRREHLRRIGGIQAFGDRLAEDVAMGQAALARGLRLGIGPRVISPVGRMAPAALLAKLKRGALAARWSSPAGIWPYGLAVLFYYGYLALLAAGLLRTDMSVLAAAACIILCEGLLQGRLAQRTDGRFRFAWHAPLAHALNLGMLALTLFDATVTWGGIRYRVRRGGRMQRIG